MAAVPAGVAPAGRSSCALLTLAVAAAIFGVGRRVQPRADAATPSSAPPTTARARRARTRRSCGRRSPRPRRGSAPIDVIGHRRGARARLGRHRRAPRQDPTAPYGAPMLGLRRGPLPGGADEVAVTDGVADALEVGVGDTSTSTAPTGRWSASSRTRATSTTSSPWSRPASRRSRTTVTMLVDADDRATGLRRRAARPSRPRHGGRRPRQTTSGRSPPAACSAWPRSSSMLVVPRRRGRLRRGRPAPAAPARHARRHRRDRAPPAARDGGQRRRRRRGRRASPAPRSRWRGLARGRAAARAARRAPDRPRSTCLVARRRRHAARGRHRDRRPRGGRPARRADPGHVRPVGPAAPAASRSTVRRWPPALLVAAGCVGLAVGIDPTRSRRTSALVLPGIAGARRGRAARQPARDPGPRRRSAGGRRSRPGWRCATWPATRPAPARPSPRSAWPRHRRRHRHRAPAPPSTPPSEGNLSDRQLLIRLGRRASRSPRACTAGRARRDLRTAVERLAADPRRAAVVAARGGRRPEPTPRADGGRSRATGRRRSAAGRRDMTRDVGVPLRRHPGAARPPRGRPRPGPRPHRRPHPAHRATCASPTCRPQRGRADGGPESMPSVRPSTSPPTPRLPASLITPGACDRRGWEPAPAGWLVEAAQPLTERPARTGTASAADAGLTVETRDDQARLTASPHRRHRRRHAARPRHPRHDRRADPQRGRPRPPHAHRHRRHQRRPAAPSPPPPPARSPCSASSSAPRAPTSRSSPATSTTWRPSAGCRSSTSSSPWSASLSAAAAGWLLAGREPPALARQPLA